MGYALFLQTGDTLIINALAACPGKAVNERLEGGFECSGLQAEKNPQTKQPFSDMPRLLQKYELGNQNTHTP